MNATVAFATADDYAFESIRLGTVGVAFEAERRDNPAFFGKSEIRSPKKFLLVSDVSHKKGVGLALGRSIQINEQLQ
jgi:hypothetical protein